MTNSSKDKVIENSSDLNISFEEIVGIIKNDSTKAILMHISLADISVALIGLDNNLVNKVKSLLPRTKRMMLDDTTSKDTHSYEQINNARNLFIDAAKYLHEEGYFNLHELIDRG